jgi:hypothetical protein
MFFIFSFFSLWLYDVAIYKLAQRNGCHEDREVGTNETLVLPSRDLEQCFIVSMRKSCIRSGKHIIVCGIVLQMFKN